MNRRWNDDAEQALRDLVELDEQVAAGEIGAGRAARLRARYEAAAAAALAEPGAPPRDPAGDGPSGSAGRVGPWRPVYLLTVAVALVAGVVLLPASVVDRPEGGAVTGIEPIADAPDGPDGSDGPAPVDPAAVDDEQLERVVAENPDVIGMRLALADRYVAAGDHGAAMRHYVEATNRRPDDPEVRTRLAWLLHTIGQTGPALENADRALAVAPDSAEAAWVRANVLLDGVGDVRAGIAVLDGLLARPDLAPEVRSRVQDLRGSALRTAGGGS